ncbi:hypothetical protein D3C80_1844720 [compost metagenome]
MVISAISTNSLPLECRDVTLAAVARLVMAITFAPTFRAASATSMVMALRPETEWISSVSPACSGDCSINTRPRPSTFSTALVSVNGRTLSISAGVNKGLTIAKPPAR